MKKTVEKIKVHRDGLPDEGQGLRRPYDKQIGEFPCRSFNLGAKTATFPHTDQGNLAQSWCSITPVGQFNHKTGGHLILWNFGLVTEFPAGSTILIPSALIVHSNTPVEGKGTRYSIVQYAAGGLFRWAENGNMTQSDYLAKCSARGLAPHQWEPGERWANSVNMYTNISEIIDKTHTT